MLLYDHKKPTGNPHCQTYVQNAKGIWEHIKEEMDVSDSEQGEGADKVGNKYEIVVPGLHPIEDVNVDAESNEEGEDGDVTASAGDSE